MISVYHTKLRAGAPKGSYSLMFDASAAEAEAILRGTHPTLEYVRVAFVYTNELEEAFELTNSVLQYWGNHAGVDAVQTCRHRSTSVGDMLERNGKRFLVANVGFVELDTPAT